MQKGLTVGEYPGLKDSISKRPKREGSGMTYEVGDVLKGLKGLLLKGLELV